MKNLFFVRHAESEKNIASEMIGGRADDTPLSRRGVEQAVSLGKRFKNTQQTFNRLYSSTALRAKQTIEHIVGETSSSMLSVITTPALLEINQGDFEGRLRTEIYTPEYTAVLEKDCFNYIPPNGESQKMVEERMLSWIKNEILDSNEQDIDALIVSHGMAIKCLLRGILQSNPQMTYKINIDNTGVSKLVHNSIGWHVLSVNDNSHLPKDGYIKSPFL